VSGIASVEINGMRINFSGTPTNNEMLLLKAQNRPAAGIRLAFDDPLKVAAANRFRVIENQFNPSGVDASLAETPVRYPQDEALWLPKVVSTSGLETLDNNIVTSEAIRLDQVSASPIAVIPEGYKDVALYLGELNGQDLELQVMTRDGRHLLGRPLADDLIAAEEANLGRALRSDERDVLIQQAGTNFLDSARLAGVSMAPGATYSSQYLNLEGDDSYRDMELFYGVKAMVQEIGALNQDHVVGGIDRLAASVTSGLVQPFSVRLDTTVGQTVVVGPEDFVLNGVSLGSLILERSGDTVQLVMQGEDNMGRSVSRVLAQPVREVSAGSNVFEVQAEHLQEWLRLQPGWGQGERQVLSFSRAEQGGSITVRFSADDSVVVSGIDPYSTPSEVATVVARALSESSYIVNMTGRYVEAMDDGSVVVQFASTDVDMPRITVDEAASGIQTNIIREPANLGLLGTGEVQTYDFSAATDTGAFDIGGARVHVQAGDSSAEVTRKVAAALSGQQRILWFAGGPNTAGTSLSLTLGADQIDIDLPEDASPLTFAEAVKFALENDDDFTENNPGLILSLEPAGGLRFTFPPSILDPDAIVLSAPAGLSVSQETPDRFVDQFVGRRVSINKDGGLSVRYLATEGNQANLGITPVRTPWPEVQTFTLAEAIPGPRTAGSFIVQGRPVAVEATDEATDTVSQVIAKTKAALEAHYQTVTFSGTALEGETLEVRIGNLTIPIELPHLSPAGPYGPEEIAQRVKDALYPNAGGPNPRDGAFAAAFPLSSVTHDGSGTLRLIFDPTAGDVAEVSIRPVTATLVSGQVSVQPRFTDQYPGAQLTVSGDSTSLIARYPTDLRDVPNLLVPSADALGLSFALATENYRETSPGVSLNATTQDFQGLSIDLLSVYDPFGKPVMGGFDSQIALSQIRFTQTPLGQGELQTMYFGPATAAGEITIAGIKVKIQNGASGAQVAELVRDALQKEFGSSLLSSTQRLFYLNADGSLSVRAAVGAAKGIAGISSRSTVWNSACTRPEKSARRSAIFW
jgi:hypothetical protein